MAILPPVVVQLIGPLNFSGRRQNRHAFCIRGIIPAAPTQIGSFKRDNEEQFVSKRGYAGYTGTTGVA